MDARHPTPFLVKKSHWGTDEIDVTKEEMNIIKKTIELPDGRVIEIETGKLAKQAAGSAVVKMGGTMLLATVTCAKEVKEGTDFMPLTVDYREKFYAA